MSWLVYILRCSDDSLYTGITNNINRRIEQHNQGTAAKYTANRRPVDLLYTEPKPDRSTASKREHQIKQLNRKQKLALISQEVGRE